ncbi:MAG: MmcQ/YjbR family DNA-binding protein [Agathobacter sp.]
MRDLDNEIIASLRRLLVTIVAKRRQNKTREHWNSIILDGSIPDSEIRRMIAESYDLITGRKG